MHAQHKAGYHVIIAQVHLYSPSATNRLCWSLLLLSSSSFLLVVVKSRLESTSISHSMVVHSDSLVSASGLDPRYWNLPLSVQANFKRSCRRKGTLAYRLTLIPYCQPSANADQLPVHRPSKLQQRDLPFSDVMLASEDLCSGAHQSRKRGNQTMLFT